jgi:hypothetical protein
MMLLLFGGFNHDNEYNHVTKAQVLLQASNSHQRVAADTECLDDCDA